MRNFMYQSSPFVFLIYIPVLFQLRALVTRFSCLSAVLFRKTIYTLHPQSLLYVFVIHCSQVLTSLSPFVSVH